MNRFVWQWMVFIAVTASLASPAFCDTERSPREVVEQFCALDFAGYRLNSSAYDKITPFVSYIEEPGWDTLVGISDYRVIDEVVENDRALVKVRYTIDRMWPIEEPIQPYEVGVIHLRRKDGQWKISQYLHLPRVSAELLCDTYDYCK